MGVTADCTYGNCLTKISRIRDNFMQKSFQAIKGTEISFRIRRIAKNKMRKSENPKKSIKQTTNKQLPNRQREQF